MIVLCDKHRSRGLMMFVGGIACILVSNIPTERCCGVSASTSDKGSKQADCVRFFDPQIN